MTQLTFTNKVEYLSYIKQWKEEYSILSKMQRATKDEVKIINRDYSQSGSSSDLIDLRSHQYKVYGNKALANQMLEDLKSAKVLAQTQYLAGKKPERYL